MILNERIHRLLILSEELHFRRAAERLHVSQPALSGSLKNLESELGIRLFRRTSRNVALTEAGNILVAEARRLIAEGERVLTLVRKCESDLVGPVLFGYSPLTNLKWIGGLISTARREGFLSAEYQFIGREAAGLREALDNGTLQGAFFAGDLRRDESGFQRVRLFRENFQAVLAAGHRLARAGAISLCELREEPVVWLRRDVDPVLHNSFAELCRSHGYRPNIVQEAGSFYECLHFAREGLGITFLPSFMSENAGGGVLFLALAGDLQIDYTLVYRRSSPHLQTVDRFAGLARDYAAKRKCSAP